MTSLCAISCSKLWDIYHFNIVKYIVLLNQLSNLRTFDYCNTSDIKALLLSPFFFVFCGFQEPWLIDFIQTIYPQANLHGQAEWKRVDTATRKSIKFISGTCWAIKIKGANGLSLLHLGKHSWICIYVYIYREREQLYSAKFKEHACTPGFLFVLSQSLLHLSGNACEYLWNKVEVAKVFWIN